MELINFLIVESVLAPRPDDDEYMTMHIPRGVPSQQSSLLETSDSEG